MDRDVSPRLWVWAGEPPTRELEVKDEDEENAAADEASARSDKPITRMLIVSETQCEIKNENVVVLDRLFVLYNSLLSLLSARQRQWSQAQRKQPLQALSQPAPAVSNTNSSF